MSAKWVIKYLLLCRERVVRGVHTGWRTYAINKPNRHNASRMGSSREVHAIIIARCLEHISIRPAIRSFRHELRPTADPVRHHSGVIAHRWHTGGKECNSR